MKPLVSVIVVNFNGAAVLPACLDSLVAQSWPHREILVVDNGSRDASRDLIRERYGRQVRLIELPENRGFAGGANAALTQAGGQFIALLNNDARAEPDWLERLVEAIQESPRIGMCASKILLEAESRIDKAGHLIFWDGQNRGRGTGQPDQGQFDLREEVLCPDGCAALYRRRLLRETGGFDEDFFAYAEDADLGLQARWMGWRCLYEPQAVVHHRQSSTTDLYAAQKVYWVERNRLWLAVKNFPAPLLLFNPAFTLYRWSWNLLAALAGRGASGSFRRQGGWLRLWKTLARAVVDASRGVPMMLRKRRESRRRHKLSDREFLALLWRFRIRARELAFQDRPPPRTS